MSVTLATALLLTGGAPAAVAAAADLRARVDAGIQAAERYDCEQAIEQLDAALADPGFASLPAYEIEYVHNRIVVCARATDEHARALEAVETLLAMTGNRSDYLVFKLALGALTEQPLASLDALRLLDPSATAMVNQYPLAMMSAIERQLGDLDASGASTLAFLDELVRIGYAPPGLKATLGPMQIRRLRLLLAHASPAAARDAVIGVSDPWALLEIKVDARYATLRDDAAVAQALDLERALTDWVELRERRLQAAPLSLQAHIEVAAALRLAGRFDDAVAVLEKPVRELGRPGGVAYRDAGEMRSWLLQEFGLSLYDAGRLDEGLSVLTAAARLPEVDGLNFSQRDMLVRKLTELGRVDLALQAMSGLDDAAPSPFLDVWRRSVRVCAQSVDPAATPSRSELIVMRKYEEYDAGRYRRAALCADQKDLLSAVITRDLSDSERRGPTLVWLQALRGGRDAPAFDVTLRARIAQVAALPEVRAALTAAGRVIDVPFHRSTSELP